MTDLSLVFGRIELTSIIEPLEHFTRSSLHIVSSSLFYLGALNLRANVFKDFLAQRKS